MTALPMLFGAVFAALANDINNVVHGACRRRLLARA